MTGNKARALTHAALIAVNEALAVEDSPADFLAAVDGIIGRPGSLLELPFDTGQPDPLTIDDARRTGKDIDNAPRVFEFLGSMDRANAADRRLWTYLAFATYRDYMERRWPLDVTNWKGRVADRWLLKNVTRGSLVRHGVGRLWWVAALTFDPHREHPLSAASRDSFAYTRAVMRNEDRINSLFDREAGALPDLVRLVLEHANSSDAQATDGHVRALMKELTLVYGYRDLAALDTSTLRALVSESAPVVASG